MSKENLPAKETPELSIVVPVYNSANIFPELLASMREHNRYLRGMRAWTGFKQTGIEYERESRFADAPGYSSRKYIALALNAIFSFS